MAPPKTLRMVNKSVMSIRKKIFFFLLICGSVVVLTFAITINIMLTRNKMFHEVSAHKNALQRARDINTHLVHWLGPIDASISDQKKTPRAIDPVNIEDCKKSLSDFLASRGVHHPTITAPSTPQFWSLPNGEHMTVHPFSVIFDCHDDRICFDLVNELSTLSSDFFIENILLESGPKDDNVHQKKQKQLRSTLKFFLLHEKGIP